MRKKGGIYQKLKLVKYLKDAETARRENNNLGWSKGIKEMLNGMKLRRKENSNG